MAYEKGAITFPLEGVKVFVGGCVERGIGSSFRARAHTHTASDDAYLGWICIRSWRRLYKADGQPSNTMLHEYAHHLTGEGHTDKWRKTLRELGGRVTLNGKKRSRG